MPKHLSQCLRTAQIGGQKEKLLAKSIHEVFYSQWQGQGRNTLGSHECAFRLQAGGQDGSSGGCGPGWSGIHLSIPTPGAKEKHLANLPCLN